MTIRVVSRLFSNASGWDIHAASMLGTAAMALLVLLLRLRAAKKPVRELNLLLPPLGMSTGFSMFLIPVMRVPPGWALGAFAAGALLLSYPLIRTSVFEIQRRRIFLKRSRAFMIIIIVLLAVRVSLHAYLERYISVAETASLFFLLAFGMLLPWRIAMYMQYQRMLKTLYGGEGDPSRSSGAAKKDWA